MENKWLLYIDNECINDAKIVPRFCCFLHTPPLCPTLVTRFFSSIWPEFLCYLQYSLIRKSFSSRKIILLFIKKMYSNLNFHKNLKNIFMRKKTEFFLFIRNSQFANLFAVIHYIFCPLLTIRVLFEVASFHFCFSFSSINGK